MTESDPQNAPSPAVEPSAEPISPALHVENPPPGPFNGWLCFLIGIALAVPIFVRMPLTNDTCLFDVQARMLRQGGTLYRDMHEPNLPGVVWLQALARTIGGDSSETMRVFDLLIVASILCCIFAMLRRQNASSQRMAAWTLTALAVFYLSLSEWCHCQRDTWVLLPVLLAAMLRLRQIDRARTVSAPPKTQHPGSWKPIAIWGVLEGLVWASGIWIKPHIVLSIVAVWIISARQMSHKNSIISDGAGLLVGGIVGGAIGVGWLVNSGSWPYFLDTLSNWNPDYLAAGRVNWTVPRFVAMFTRFFPWMLVHFAAIPIAVVAITRSFRRADTSTDSAAETAAPNSTEPNSSDPSSPQPSSSHTHTHSNTQTNNSNRNTHITKSVLAAVYLTWLAHSFFLQHLFDYVHVPAVFLAVALYSLQAATSPHASRFRTVGLLFACLVVATNPIFSRNKLAQWKDSFSNDSIEFKDQLAHFENPRRADLAKVAAFLETQNVKTHDVCCFNSDCVSIYWNMNLLPATRFTYLFELMNYHPTRQADFQKALETHTHRFVVTDLVSSGMSFQDAMAIDPNNPLLPPKYPRAKNVYPWSHKVVFRAGTYLVHEVSPTIGHLRMPTQTK